MAILNLTGQGTISSQLQTRFLTMRDAMNLRLPVWNRISREKKKLWVTSGKDPLMSLAWAIYRYLRDNFFGEDINV